MREVIENRKYSRQMELWKFNDVKEDVIRISIFDTEENDNELKFSDRMHTTAK